MISWLAALTAVLLAAAAALASSAQGARGRRPHRRALRYAPPPAGGAALRLVAGRVRPRPGVDPLQRLDRGKRFRNIRLVWENSIARCFLRVPAGARGKRLTIGLADAAARYAHDADVPRVLSDSRKPHTDFAVRTDRLESRGCDAVGQRLADLALNRGRRVEGSAKLLVTRSTLTGEVVRTVAVRGASVRSAISPTKSLGRAS